jgi:ubiquinone/menaquinone biosynthesis C-methylase UbiE
VHSQPRFYQWKLGALNVLKSLFYRVLFINDSVNEQRRAIQERNTELLAKHLTGKRVLEIGCGRGSFLASLSERYGCRCVGVDVAAEMIEYAREHNPGPEYHALDSAKLPFADREFDVVVFNYVLHHLARLDDTIAEAKRVARAVVFYESCPWGSEPFKGLARFYWKTTDGGFQYLTLTEWKERFALPVLDEIEGTGFVRYGMGVLKAD